MKILYAASSVGHINNFHKSYIEALRNDGNTVLVMANGNGADFDIPFEKKLFSSKNRSCRKQIRHILDAEKFDAVILNTTLAAFHIRLAMRGKSRPRVINIVHGYLFSLMGGGLRRRMLLFCERYLRRKTDKILVMNNEDLEIAEKYKLSLDGVAITRGMGATARNVELDRLEMRNRLSSENNYVMTFVGELSDRKNQALLIEGLKEIKKEISNAVLWLVGEGEKRDGLEALSVRLGVFDSVRFVGYTDSPCDFVGASDLYVSASRIEGMPFNIIEALGVGMPIVASDIKGHRDLLSSGAGVLFKSCDASAFSGAVIAHFKGEAHILSEKAHEVYEKYSFNSVFDETYAKIKEALEP